MPDYSVKAMSAEGVSRRHRVAGRDAEEACARLRAGGVFVERIAPAVRSGRFLARTRIAAAHRVEFFRQMETLLASGVLIADALHRLKDRYPDARTRRVLREVHALVAASRTSLSQALARFPRSFPSGTVTIVEAGEEGGAALLAERFGDLADRTAYEEANRREVFRACAYPLFVLALAAAVYVLLLGVVFPRIADLLASLGGRLPPLTRRVIGLSRWVRAWLPALVALAAGLPVLAMAARRIAPVRRLVDRAWLRLPLIGGIHRDLMVALVCKVFCSLYKANKPAPEIVELCAKMTGNRAFREGLLGLREAMLRGAPVSEAFARSGLFPPLACLAIDAGERSGRLPQALDRVADYCGARARRRIAAALAVLNPLMTLLIVGGVGAIMISFFQAVYQIIYVAR